VAELLVRCVHGLEWVCADEVTRLPGATGLQFARREVMVQLPVLDPAVLGLRTADDVFLAVGSGTGATPDEIASALSRLAWEERVDDVRALRTAPSAPALDVVAALEGHRFSRYAVEHAVGRALAARLGGTYLRRTAEGREPGEPDLTVRVAVRDGAVAAALRIAARPLHRRDWKRDTGPGTLHPPLAAMLARLTDPAPRQSVLDPFCGDGTIAIETALACPGIDVTGRDLDAGRLANAAANAARAGVAVRFDRADAGGRSQDRFDAVVTNPPWNLSVDGAGTVRRGLGPFWRRLPALLAPEGRFVAVADVDLDAPAALVEAGFAVRMAITVRLAGRVAHVVLGAPRTPPALAGSLDEWRERAVGAGVVTAEGF
jgi:23S rRNA G2445 N2-methylase RlmL